MKVAVSFLKSNLSLEDTIEKISQTDCDSIHVDMMDGIFVEDANYSVAEIKQLFKSCHKRLDVHMMCCSPNKYVKEFAKMKNIEYLILHYESHRRPIDVINMIRHTSLKVGIAINPETKVHKIIPMLNHIDLVLVMSVKPGKGGQEFMKDVLYKIETLKQIREENHYSYLISVDGGINDKTANLCKEAGADMVVSGFYVCNSDDYQKQIDTLR